MIVPYDSLPPPRQRLRVGRLRERGRSGGDSAG